MYAKCSGILNAAQYRRKSDWTCDACSAPPSQKSTPPTRSPAPPTEQISDNSTFNVLQLNANGIGNKLTELGVVLERNKVKVAVIQESKLSPKSKNLCIQNYTTVWSKDNGLQAVNCQVIRPTNCCHLIPSNRFFDGFPDPSQFAAAKLTHYSTMPHRPSDSSRPRPRLLLSGDVHQNPGPPTKYPCHKSWGALYVQSLF